LTTFLSSSSGWFFFKSFASSFQSTTPYHFSHCIHVGHHLSELPINQFLSIRQPVLLLFTYICSVHAVFFLNVILSQFTRPVQLNSSSIVLLSNSLALVQKSSFSFRLLFSCSLCLTTHGLVSVWLGNASFMYSTEYLNFMLKSSLYSTITFSPFWW
jgi:hypothetical protein